MHLLDDGSVLLLRHDDPALLLHTSDLNLGHKSVLADEHPFPEGKDGVQLRFGELVDDFACVRNGVPSLLWELLASTR
jgi:hypothetical protein